MIQEIYMYLAMFFEVCELESAPKVTEIVSANMQKLLKTRKLPCCPVLSLERDYVEVLGQLMLWLEESEPGRGGDFVAGLWLTFQMQSLVLLVCVPHSLGKRIKEGVTQNATYWVVYWCCCITRTWAWVTIREAASPCLSSKHSGPSVPAISFISPYLSHECWKMCLLPEVQGKEECA